MRLFNSILLSFGVAALGASAPVVRAQATPSPASSGVATATQSSTGASAPTLKAYSRLTVVDVTVTDSKGQPVHGLSKDNFTVKEDGKAQPIEGFLEMGEDRAAGQRPAPKLPQGVYTNAQPAPAGSAVNILLLDTLNTTNADQIALRQESMKYIRTMPQGTRVAVLGLGTSLRILQGFTSDPALLIAAVDSKKNRALPSPFDSTDIDDTLNSQIDNTVTDGVAAVMTQFENEESSFPQDVRTHMTLEALNQIAGYVAGMKGRKNLVWFTSGMPLNIFPTGAVNDLKGMTDYTKDLRKTADLLTDARVAVYPVDAHALANTTSLDATRSVDAINVKTASKVTTSDMSSTHKPADEQLSMLAIAEATGGVAYMNSNGLKDSVASAIENGSNYYILSYVPPDPEFDGRHHSIDVEADQPGLHLAYRRGYDSDDIANNEITPGVTLSVTAPEPYGDNFQASMARDVPPSSQVLFDVRVAPTAQPPKPSDPPLIGELDPKLKGRSLVRYDLEYFFPTRQVTFAQGASGAQIASLQFEVAAYDVYGKLITRISQTRSLELDRDKYQQFVKARDQQYFQQIDLPHGEIFLRVGILDGVSDRVGTLEVPLLVTKDSAVQAGQTGGSGGN